MSTTSIYQVEILPILKNLSAALPKNDFDANI